MDQPNKRTATDLAIHALDYQCDQAWRKRYHIVRRSWFRVWQINPYRDAYGLPRVL